MYWQDKEGFNAFDFVENLSARLIPPVAEWGTTKGLLRTFPDSPSRAIWPNPSSHLLWKVSKQTACTTRWCKPPCWWITRWVSKSRRVAQTSTLTDVVQGVHFHPCPTQQRLWANQRAIFFSRQQCWQTIKEDFANRYPTLVRILSHPTRKDFGESWTGKAKSFEDPTTPHYHPLAQFRRSPFRKNFRVPWSWPKFWSLCQDERFDCHLQRIGWWRSHTKGLPSLL